jgi:hypothetical protein
MFHVTREFFHIANAPPDTSLAKADQIIASFRFV